MGEDRPGMISCRERRQSPPPLLFPTLIPSPHLSKDTATAVDLHQELPRDLCQCCLLHQQPLLATDLESLPKAPLRLHPHKCLS